MAEVRSVSSTGGEKGVKPEQYDLIPVGPQAELARHYAKGAEKYKSHQWRKGYEWSKSYNALKRHLDAFWGGEDIDEETGSKHVTAVAWHAFALIEFMNEFPEFDDRYKKPVKEDVQEALEAVIKADPESYYEARNNSKMIKYSTPAELQERNFKERGVTKPSETITESDK